MKTNPEIPTPAHPHKRREALPWQQPKATEEDPDAFRRVQAIVNSPSYRLADADTAFLAEDGLRGVRLQIDYLKPELLLQEHKIHHTREPGMALRHERRAQPSGFRPTRCRCASVQTGLCGCTE